jgi:hypothetical protein
MVILSDEVIYQISLFMMKCVTLSDETRLASDVINNISTLSDKKAHINYMTLFGRAGK